MSLNKLHRQLLFPMQILVQSGPIKSLSYCLAKFALCHLEIKRF